MKPLNPMEKRRLNIFLIIGGTILTIVLAIAVISISVLLEKRGSTPTAPTAPASKPKAANAGQCSISFTVTGSPSPSPSATPSPTPSTTPSPTPSVTPSPTPSPTPPVSCNSTCTSNANCQSGLVCSGAGPGQTGFCRNPLCTGSTSCLCPTPSPTPPNGCNNGCVSNSDCASGMICSSNLCRSAVCPASPNCLCVGTPTPTTGTSRPTPTTTEQLPKAGSVLGTTTVFGLGTIITILGIIGFFAL